MNKDRFHTVLTISLALLFVMLFSAANPLAIKTSLDIDPDDFVSEIDNEFFPLEPGTRFIYEGESDGVPTREEVEVTRDTIEILGVTCTVVHARAYDDGVLIEDTFDWYAQDKQGNVWYFGEDTKELDADGNVISTEGSWQAGVNGAEPGIIMMADPKKGVRYQQEDAPDVAEDMAQILGFEDDVCVAYGCFDNVLVTKEWTPLEKGVVENKYYASGIGFIYGVMIKGGEEQIGLTQIR